MEYQANHGAGEDCQNIFDERVSPFASVIMRRSVNELVTSSSIEGVDVEELQKVRCVQSIFVLFSSFLALGRS